MSKHRLYPSLQSKQWNKKKNLIYENNLLGLTSGSKLSNSFRFEAIEARICFGVFKVGKIAKLYKLQIGDHTKSDIKRCLKITCLDESHFGLC